MVEGTTARVGHNPEGISHNKVHAGSYYAHCPLVGYAVRTSITEGKPYVGRRKGFGTAINGGIFD